MRRILIKATAASAGALALNACGFRLRGNTELPFNTLWVNFAATSRFGNEFRRQLRNNDKLQVVSERANAQVILLLNGERTEKVVSGFSSSGAIREYQLFLRIRYEVLNSKGLELIKNNELSLKRDVTTTDAQIVAKEREDELLYREMLGDSVQQVLRRLSAIPPAQI